MMVLQKFDVKIYTDGACSGNPGIGGWGAVLSFNNEIIKEISGNNLDTTNNRMELTAVIEALKCLEHSKRIQLWSDSTYVVNSIGKGWLDSWQKNNWKNSSKKSVLNRDLWQEFLEVSKIHELSVFWLKGHDGNYFNERCDNLATQAILELRKRLKNRLLT